MDFLLRLEQSEFLGGISEEEASPTPIEGAAWYLAEKVGDGIRWRFDPGAFASAKWLTADFLADGFPLPVFELRLREGEAGPVFRCYFALLNQCSARLRLPLEATNQNQWMYPREGALLKPHCGGDRVDLRRVDRAELIILRKSAEPVRWCMTPFAATAEEPPLLTEPVLPKGKLLDDLGQSALRDWEGKSRNRAEVMARLSVQLDEAPTHILPDGFSSWGGWTARRFDATGFFRTHHDGQRWWLVDPDGYPFWSAGLDCVRVDTDAKADGLESALTWIPDPGPANNGQGRLNYLAANLIRTFGTEEWFDKWAEIALGQMKRLGFNTVGNWSEWRIARRKFPYVMPLHLRFDKTPHIYRDFPDVYHPGFAADAEAFAEQLREVADDPALVGYFLTNEPQWGFSQETPASGMLYTTETCETRTALADFLRRRHGTNAGLAQAWGMATTFDEIARGKWSKPLTDAAKADLKEFSGVMVEKLFGGLSAACKRVDPNHLNLGVRYAYVGEGMYWAVSKMDCFDVFSINCYRSKVIPTYEKIAELLNRPLMVGEWHFGALDVGLPASGIGHVRDQKARGQAYRVYLEDAASKPWLVGVHYFTMYDESALGRFDGENYQIGFFDVCNHPYAPLAEAARLSHERMYVVASGETPPFAEEPEYLPLLF